MNRFELVVKPKVAEVLSKLEGNLTTHRNIFELAMERFKEEAVRLLTERCDQIRDDKTTRTYIDLPVPEDHSDDYERAISMLKMHTEDTIELPESMYRQFYDDDWDWKQRWVGTTAAYVS